MDTSISYYREYKRLYLTKLSEMFYIHNRRNNMTTSIMNKPSSDKLANIITAMSKGKVSMTKANAIVDNLDLTAYYEIKILQDECDARQFLRLMETKSNIKGVGKKQYSTESGNIIEGRVKFGQCQLVIIDDTIVSNTCSVKELPSGVLDSFVVIKTKQTFNFADMKSEYGETCTDYILGIYVNPS